MTDIYKEIETEETSRKVAASAAATAATAAAPAGRKSKTTRQQELKTQQQQQQQQETLETDAEAQIKAAVASYVKEAEKTIKNFLEYLNNDKKGKNKFLDIWITAKDAKTNADLTTEIGIDSMSKLKFNATMLPCFLKYEEANKKKLDSDKTKVKLDTSEQLPAKTEKLSDLKLFFNPKLNMKKYKEQMENVKPKRKLIPQFFIPKWFDEMIIRVKESPDNFESTGTDFGETGTVIKQELIAKFENIKQNIAELVDVLFSEKHLIIKGKVFAIQSKEIKFRPLEMSREYRKFGDAQYLMVQKANSQTAASSSQTRTNTEGTLTEVPGGTLMQTPVANASVDATLRSMDTTDSVFQSGGGNTQEEKEKEKEKEEKMRKKMYDEQSKWMQQHYGHNPPYGATKKEKIKEDLDNLKDGARFNVDVFFFLSLKSEKPEEFNYENHKDNPLDFLDFMSVFNPVECQEKFATYERFKKEVFKKEKQHLSKDSTAKVLKIDRVIDTYIPYYRDQYVPLLEYIENYLMPREKNGNQRDYEKLENIELEKKKKSDEEKIKRQQHIYRGYNPYYPPPPHSPYFMQSSSHHHKKRHSGGRSMKVHKKSHKSRISIKRKQGKRYLRSRSMIGRKHCKSKRLSK